MSCGPTPSLSRQQVYILSAIAFFMVAISWSPLLSGTLSLNSNFTNLAALLVFLVSIARARGINPTMLLLGAALTAASLILAIFSESTLLWKRTVPVGLLLLVAHQIANIKHVPKLVCNLLSTWSALGIILSITGFIYALSGGEPVLTITNPDGRENFLYLTTMSGAVYGNVIRPAWIYDEPGAFSFVICATVALRHLLKMNNRLSTFLILGGLVTLSLAHMIVAVLYMIARYGFGRVIVILAIVGAVFTYLTPNLDSFEFLVARFAIEDGRLAGDNRSNQIDNFIDIATYRTFLFGNIECHARPDGSCHEHGDISSSPVTPVYHGGIFLLTVQLVTQFALVIALFTRRGARLSAAILSILLLQRPYFADFSYGLIIYMTLFLMFRRNLVARRALSPNSRVPI